jgi:type IX secretion system PorP/SprF family membrane protein
VTTDNQANGTLKTTTGSMIYSYYAPVTRSFNIRAALQATYLQETLDRSQLTFGDMIDARRGFVWNTEETIPSQNKSNVDFSAGMIGYGANYFFGVAVNHINQPDVGLLGASALPAKITIHGGGTIQLEKREEHYLSPNILFQQQQKFMQLDIGLYYVRGPFVAGLWYRSSDAAIGLIGIQNKRMKIGYSYDVTISKLAANTAGSHEISMQLNFTCHHSVRKLNIIRCPIF